MTGADRSASLSDSTERHVDWRSRPIAVALIGLVAACLFVGLRLHSYDWNPTGLVRAGSRFVDASEAPSGLIVRKGAVGFDGTGFYRLALNPLTRSVKDQGIVLDLPAFRQQRILYPALAWIASGGGRPTAVPWALIVVNVIAFACVGWLGGALALSIGRPAWLGLAMVAYPGFAVSLGLDTAEILASGFALGGLLAMVRHRPAWAVTLLTAAMFTRETTLLLVVGAAIASIAARRARRPAPFPAYVFVIPMTAYVAWQGFLWNRWGTLPLRQGSGVDISFPLAGLFKMAPEWSRTDGAQAVFQYALVIAMAFFLVMVVRGAIHSTAPDVVRWGTVLAIALGLLFSDAIWLHHWGFLRAFTEAYLLGTLVILGSALKRLDRLVVAASTFWAAIAINLIVHP